ncbi:MAG: hypothetical protein KKE73_09050 [Proteobacteria bacterium]|nr:hypothetical protein [Pseudomonadota bacterium]
MPYLKSLAKMNDGEWRILAGIFVSRLGDFFEVGSWGRLDRLFTIEETVSLLTEEGQTNEVAETIRGEGPSG